MKAQFPQGEFKVMWQRIWRLDFDFNRFYLFVYWIVQFNRVFAYNLSDQGSISSRVISRTQKSYLMLPYLTLSIIRYGSNVKWCNLRKGVAIFLMLYNILSFGLVRLRTIRLSARVGAHIERRCLCSRGEDVTITDVIIKTSDRKWNWCANDVMPGSVGLGILVILKRSS